jgi:ceramide glucosyltransferase
MVSTFAAFVVAMSALWIVSGLVALALTTRASRRARSASVRRVPPVTVLKPLAGADPGLEANLESFFTQDHPDFEIVFGVEDEADPALDVARRLVARHPRVRTRIVVHATRGGHNPKVRNLRGMIGHASHDLVLVSDSNIRVASHVVRELAAIAASRPSVGVVTSAIAGTGDRSLAGALEAVQLAGFVAAGATLPTRFGDALVIGKSMLFSRRMLDALGGLERVADVLAEDHVLGKTFQHAGLDVHIAPTPVDNVIGRVSLRTVFERHVRWGLIRFRLRPFAYLLEPITSPLLLVPIAALAMPWPAAIATCLALAWIRDVGGWLVLRGAKRLHVPLLLAPVRDVFALAVWMVAPLRRHVAWRGNRVRVGPGTLLYTAVPASEARPAWGRRALRHVATSSARRAPPARARSVRAAA